MSLGNYLTIHEIRKCKLDISTKKMKTSQHKSLNVSWKLFDYTWNKKMQTRYFYKENENESTQFFIHFLEIIGLYMKLKKCNIQIIVVRQKQ